MAGKILRFLPKAASFSIPNSSSSSKSNKHMFSGPIVPMIPDHCRRKSSGMLEEEEEEGEPASPKVSCIGQVNHNKKSSNSKKNKKKKMTTTMKKEKEKEKEEEEQRRIKKKEKEKEAPKRSSSIGGMFWRSKAARPARPRDVEDSSDDEAVGAPGIGRMRRYASGRDTLKDFDWRTTIVQNNNDDELVEEEEKEAAGQLVPHSAPILVGGGAVALEPKKEMNIWRRRRTITPPLPLQLQVN